MISPHISHLAQPLPWPPHLPYMVGLNFPNLRKLINDPIAQDLAWPSIPTKLTSDIPKFEGKEGEYPINHIM